MNPPVPCVSPTVCRSDGWWPHPAWENPRQRGSLRGRRDSSDSVCEERSDPESERTAVSVTNPKSAAVDAPTPGRVAVLASKVPPAAIVAIAGAGIGIVIVFGILQRAAFPEWGFANLDSEASFATWFSSGLLWAAAFWWFLIAVTSRPRTTVLWIWWPVLAWLALDEGTAIHERVERWSGVDWQILYLPVMALATWAWWGVLRRYRSQTRIAVPLIAVATVWIVALALELVQNWGGSPIQAAVYDPTMILEEALEMVGATALLVAAASALRLAVRPTPETGE